jgi:NAD(P)H-hydrate epimerase
MPSEYITSEEMHAIEINSEYFGISLVQLMENAGRNIALEINSRFKQNQKIAIFCGLGGNGGDGFVAARHLLAMGYKISVILIGKEKDIVHEAALQNWIALQPLNKEISIEQITDSSMIPKIEADVVVDALLGTGSKGKLKPLLSKIVEYINSMKKTVVAVDVPTGINSDTGEVLGNAVKADITVTFYKAKKGLETAKKYAGEIIVRDIGLPSILENFAGPGDVLLATKTRASNAHKGDSGRLLTIGGSEVFSGAPALMSLAALRTGVDIALTAAPEVTAHDIASMSPDLIVIKLEGKNLNPSNINVLKKYIESVDAVALGPGLGLSLETRKFVKVAIDIIETAGKPLLLDADGLKAFAKFKRPLKVPAVLTPHAGEYAILTGKELPPPEDMAKRIQAIKETAEELNAVLLVKGEIDIISDGKRIKLNYTGNSGMSVGGTGDVLSGIIGALLAQKIDAFEAAVAGAFVNGAAGDIVADEVGNHMIASDLLDWIPMVLNNPLGNLKGKMK